LKKKKKDRLRHKAGFLCPYENDSIEEAGFKFINSLSDRSQKDWWYILVERIKDQVKGEGVSEVDPND